MTVLALIAALALPAAAQRVDIVMPTVPPGGPWGPRGKAELRLAAGYGAAAADALDLDGYGGWWEARARASDRVTLSGGSGGFALGGTMETGNGPGLGSLLAARFFGRLEWRAAGDDRRAVSLFAGAELPIIWLELPGNVFAIPTGPTTPPSSMIAILYGFQFGVQGGWRGSRWSFAPYASASPCPGGPVLVNFTAPNPIKKPGVDNVDAFWSFSAGAELRYEPWGLAVGGGWQHSTGAGANPSTRSWQVVLRKTFGGRP